MKHKVRDIAEVLPAGCWKGRRCFIVGGGPSLRKFNYNLLTNELTIGVNKAFLAFNPIVTYCMDMRFYEYVSHILNGDIEQRKVCEAWKNYSGYKVFLNLTPRFQFTDDIITVKRLSEKILSLDLNKGIYAGSNSGFGALMLAAAFEASPIYLLGFDMKINKQENQTHWHNGYPNQPLGTFERRLKRFAILFEEFAPILAKKGIEVINLCPTSDLTCFPRKDIRTVFE